MVLVGRHPDEVARARAVDLRAAGPGEEASMAGDDIARALSLSVVALGGAHPRRQLDEADPDQLRAADLVRGRRLWGHGAAALVGPAIPGPDYSDGRHLDAQLA